MTYTQKMAENSSFYRRLNFGYFFFFFALGYLLCLSQINIKIKKKHTSLVHKQFMKTLYMYSTIRNIYRHRTQQAFDFICVFVNLNIFFKKEKEDRNDFYRFIFSFNTPKPKRRKYIITKQSG